MYKCLSPIMSSVHHQNEIAKKKSCEVRNRHPFPAKWNQREVPEAKPLGHGRTEAQNKECVYVAARQWQWLCFRNCQFGTLYRPRDDLSFARKGSQVPALAISVNTTCTSATVLSLGAILWLKVTPNFSCFHRLPLYKLHSLWEQLTVRAQTCCGL